jgi:transcription elongation GreA/GreB family factor
MDKQALVDRVVEMLSDELATLAAVAAVSRENAIGDQARAEGQYDTRALESSYRAAGQGRRMAELREEIEAWRSLPRRDFAPDTPIALGALVEVEARGARAVFILGPGAAGQEIPDGAGGTVMAVTPQSPMGRNLLGKTVGAIVRLDAVRQWRIARVW